MLKGGYSVDAFSYIGTIFTDGDITDRSPRYDLHELIDRSGLNWSKIHHLRMSGVKLDGDAFKQDKQRRKRFSERDAYVLRAVYEFVYGAPSVKEAFSKVNEAIESGAKYPVVIIKSDDRSLRCRPNHNNH